MSNILIAADSWGIGVYATVNNEYGPIGYGPQDILKNLGHNVINVSKGGGSNWLAANRISQDWTSVANCRFGVSSQDRIDFNINDVDYIIFIQTDALREFHYYKDKWKVLPGAVIRKLLTFDTLLDAFDNYFNSLYKDLNKHNIPVLCVGGWGKLHSCISRYQNLVPVLPSAIQFLIPEFKNDSYLGDFEWYTQLADHTEFSNKFSTELKQLTVIGGEKMDLVCKHWGDVHPTKDGYEAIVNSLLAYIK